MYEKQGNIFNAPQKLSLLKKAYRTDNNWLFETKEKDDESMQEIISLFAGKYGLTRNEVMAEIENVFSTILSQWYRLEVLVFFRKDLQLEAVAYSRIGGLVIQRNINLAEIRGPNTLKRNQEKSLLKAAVLKQTKQYKYYEKQLCRGEIVICDSRKNFHVEIEVFLGKK